MKTLKKFLDGFLQAGMIICIAGLIAVVMIQVITRYSFIKSPSWTEEAARYLFLYTIAFAAGLAVKEKAYVNVDFVFNLLPRTIEKVLNILIYAGLVIFSGVIFVQGIKFAELGLIQRSSVLMLPMQYIFGVIPISGLFLIIYFVIELVSMIKNFAAGLGGEQK
ncbi:TRAP transporter small permease [Paradesulfitobacterium ferrireducens]|uniref:TRAP transporter small permease n=1 Tax=Paradesulfitobacterium ferrireducens TaxID=2816476 RepID=UPI001A8E4E2A|nr:TRAP transporter small permease [Paradesulfitobacterium ferrireducens]